MGTSSAEAPEIEDRPAVIVTSELELGGGAAATFETTDARGDAPALEAQASVLHGERSAQARADRGGEGAAALSGGESGGPEDGGGTRRPLGRQTHEPQRERGLAEAERRAEAVAHAQRALATVRLEAFAQVNVLVQSAENRARRRELKEKGREEQRRRMHLYLRAAMPEPPPERQAARRVAFDAGTSARVRVPKPGKRRPVQIAPVEASAFCVPETAPARPAETGGDEGREGEPGVPTSPSARQAGDRETTKSPPVETGGALTVPSREAEVQGMPVPVVTESPRKQRRFVVLFAGRERPHSLRDALQRLGGRADTYELLDGPEQDLSKPTVQSIVLAGVAAGTWDGVFMAPPCASFCPALVPRLRSLTEVKGIQPVPARWSAYLAKHNALVAFVAKVATAADAQGTFWAIENPASRRGGWAWWPEQADAPSLWDMPEIVELRRATKAARRTFAQCQFGSEYQKYTSVMVSARGEAELVRAFGAARCSCRDQGREHAKVAAGSDEFGSSLSAPSAAYPPKLNLALAEMLDRATGGRRETRCTPTESGPTQALGLNVGSDDPHVLQLDDDKVARSRKRPTFSLRSHTAATQGELSSRPVAQMNAPVATADTCAAPVQAAGHPTVRNLNDLLYPSWAKRVTHWRRQMRRCLTLAEYGDWRAARRMRPADLLVPIEAMLPAVRAWEWDLRPWAVGLPAVPTVPSSFEGVRPATSIDVGRLEREMRPGGDLEHYPDRAILQQLRDGVSDDVPPLTGSFLCGPHTGALQHIELATSKLNAVIEGGWGSAHSNLPYWPMRSDPYGIADETARAGKPKFRLTNDHSWPPAPRGEFASGVIGDAHAQLRSLNGSMDRSSWPEARLPRVHQVAEAAAVLQTAGARVTAAAVDVVAYYKQFGRQSREWHRNCAVTKDGFIVDERCCFGSAADATKCARVSSLLVHRARKALQRFDAAHPSRDPKVVEWLRQRRAAGEALGCSDVEIVERWACMHALGMYVDDAGLISIDDAVFDSSGAPVMRHGVQLTRAWAHFEILKASLAEMGLETTKEQPPSSVLTLLGVEINLDTRRMRVSDDKRVKYAERASTVAALTVVGRDEFLGLLGRLNFAATFYPRGRQWLHAPWRAVRAQYRTATDQVVISKAVREQLRLWVTELGKPDHEGVPIGAAEAFPAAASSEVSAIYADAALECAGAGFCAWTVDGDELLYVQGEWSSAERESYLICDLELAASTFGLVALASETTRSFVYSFTDNVVAMAAMRTAAPRTEMMQALCGARSAWLLHHGVAEAVERITSKANLWADLGSRGRLASMLEQARSLGLRPRRVDVPAEWRDMLAAGAVGTGGDRDGPERALLAHQPAPLVACGSTRDSGAQASGRHDADRVAVETRGVREQRPGVRAPATADGRPLVREVLRARQGPSAHDGAQPALAVGGTTRGDAAVDGLRRMAGGQPPLGSPHRSQDDRQVPLARPDVAPAGVLPGHHRGRFRAAQGAPQGHRKNGGAATQARALGRADAGPRRVDAGDAQPGVGGGLELVRGADVRLLRAAQGGRVLPPTGGGLRPGEASDAGRRHVRHGGRRLRVRRDPHAAGEAHRRDQDGPAGARRRGDASRPGACAQAPVRHRPGARGATGNDAAVQAGRPAAVHRGAGARDRQVPDAESGARPAQVRGALAADWRRDSSPVGRPEPGGDPSGGALGKRRVHPVHEMQHALGGAVSERDRLDSLRGHRAGDQIR